MKYAYPRQRELHLIKKKTRVENAETLTNTANDIISMKREFRQKSRMAMLNVNSDGTINEDLNESSPSMSIN